jgi:hypothetical protein
MKGQIDQIGEGEKENTLQYSQEMEKEENFVELLKKFNQGYEHEPTVKLESTTEGDEN